MILLWFYFSGLLDRYVYSFLAVRSGYMLSTAECLTGTDTVNAKYSVYRILITLNSLHVITYHQGRIQEDFWGDLINPYPAVHDNPYLCKQCRSRSDGFKKPSDQDLHCLSFSLWIWMKTLYDVIWLVYSQKWVWLIKLFSRIRIKTYYHTYSAYSNKQAWAKSEDPDQML